MTFHCGKVSRSKRLPLQEPTAGCVVKVKAHGAQLLLGQNYALFRLQKIKLSLQIESAQRRRIQVAKQICGRDEIPFVKKRQIYRTPFDIYSL